MPRHTMKTIHRVWRASHEPGLTNRAIGHECDLTFRQVRYIRYQLLEGHEEDLRALKPLPTLLSKKALAVAKKLNIRPNEMLQAGNEMQLARRTVVVRKFLKENPNLITIPVTIQEWEEFTRMPRSRAQLARELEPGLNALFGTSYEPYHEFLQKTPGRNWGV